MAVGKVIYKIVLNKEKRPDSYITPKGWGIRHLQTFLLFLCVVMGYALRSQLSVLMVAMVDSSVHDDSNATRNEVPINSTSLLISDKEFERVENIENWSVYRTYDWNKGIQEIVTFSFFIGYTIMQLPMSWLVQKIGSKIPIMIALAFNGVTTFCVPWILLFGGYIGASICRMLQGMTQASLDPAVLTMLAKWIPSGERSRMTSYAFSGCSMGTIVAFLLSGILAGNPDVGWPAAFWLFGVLTLLACSIFSWLSTSVPEEHPKMTEDELVYILEDFNIQSKPKKRNTPWKDILKSRAVWANLIAQAGSGAFTVLILTEMPLYMSYVLEIDVKRSGLYSSLPFIAMCLAAISFGNLADFATNKNIMSIVNIRRMGNTIGSVASGAFLIAFSYANNIPLAICLLILTMGTASGNQVGFIVNQIDLAPNFAASIMALGNMCGNLTSLLVPVVVSNIITDVKNQEQWRTIFFIFVGFNVVCNTVFVIFAKGEVQPWNDYGVELTDSEKKKQSLIEDNKQFISKHINEV